MNPLKDHSDEQLLSLLRKDNEAAFAELFNRHAPKVRALAHAKLNSIEGAHEIVQETFMHLWERRESLNIDALPNYLAVAVKYQTFNYIRKKITVEKYNNYVKAFVQVITDETSESIELMGLKEAIEKGMSRLPQKTQTIFKLNRIEHKSIAEIAKELNLSQQAIKYHIGQSLKELRLHLKEFILTIGIITLLHFLF